MVVESNTLSAQSSIYIMPLFFAISHLHWCIVDILDDKVTFKKGLLIVLFKLAYTELFGVYSGVIYVRTGSLWPAILLHAQCNFFGFPHFWNITKNEFRLTDRIIPALLYLFGLIFFFW